MAKSQYGFFETVISDPEVSEKMTELYRITHENYEARIAKVEEILKAVDGNPNQASIKFKLELMLHNIHEEQDEAHSKKNMR